MSIVILKHMIEKVKGLAEELEYEWFTYTHLRKFERLTKKRNR